MNDHGQELNTMAVSKRQGKDNPTPNKDLIERLRKEDVIRVLGPILQEGLYFRLNVVMTSFKITIMWPATC